jgi:Trk K+ transport system NAD-binding subunit
VQGTSMPFLAPRLGVPMRAAPPGGTQRFRVAEGSRAAGEPVRTLPLSERTWVQEVRRDGAPLGPRGSLVLEPGDEVTLVLDVEDARRIERLFAPQP